MGYTAKDKFKLKQTGSDKQERKNWQRVKNEMEYESTILMVS